jgi:hypothetical protein
MKSPLLAYKSDMRGNYANPKYVKEELVGVKIGEALTKAGTDIFSGLTTKPKSESGDGSGSGGWNVTINNDNNNNGSNVGSESNTDTEVSNTDTDLNRRTEVLEEQGSGGFSGQSAKDLLDRNLTNKESKWKDDEVKRLGGIQQYRDHYKIGKEKDKFHTETTNEYENEKLTSSVVKDLLNPISMKGSPNKLIGDTMDPYGQINPGAVPPNQAQNDLGAQPIISANGSQPSNRSIDMSAISDPYSALGADFGAGTRNKAQSIYGSAGQRQGLMNLGTPLHHDSEKQAHSHPSKTTTKMKPDGEYPGARYVKGDLVDQDDLLDKTKLDAHIATQVQSDKKGTFIKEKSDDGPGSDIETSKGFGKKIRLESMGRSSYTSNMKDQMDPHDFLFKNTPKK